MVSPEFGVSRRKFLAYLLGATSVAATGGIVDFLSQFDFSEGVQAPEKDRWLHFPNELRGAGVCAPYLWKYADEVQRQALSAYAASGIRVIRIFADSSSGTLSDIRRLNSNIELVYQITGHQLSLVATGTDLYNLLHSNKFTPFYESKQPDHWVISQFDSLEQARLEFFINQKVINQTCAMLEHIVYRLADCQHIAAFEIANEPEIQAKAPDELKRRILSEWMMQLYQAMRQVDNTRPIFSGTRYPWDIEESWFSGFNFVATAHLYPQLTGNLIRKFFDHLKISQLPLVIGEVGMSNKLPAQDLLLPAFVQNLNNANRGACSVPSFYFWQADPEHKDSFELWLGDQRIKKTIETINKSVGVETP
jgi:hypothetical protein